MLIVELLMIELHPEILRRTAKTNSSSYPHEEFIALQELLNDYEDLLDLRAAKKQEHAEPSVPLAEVKNELGL
jgi:hypothetical protein